MKMILRTSLAAMCIVALAVAAEPYVVERGPDWIPLKVENEVAEGSALDLSFLHEGAPTGSLPRVVARGCHFEFADSPGVTRRFYGVNICGEANFAPPARAEAFVRQLRRRGYNALRLHHHDNGLVAGSADGTTINPERLDRLDAFVASCARNGLYVTTDLFVSRRIPWRVLGQDRDGFVGQEEFKELVLVNEAAYSNLCVFARAWMTHVNPYTGFRWADDPTVAFIALVNEGHLGIGGLEKLNRHPEYAAAWKEYAARVGSPYEEIPSGKPWDRTDEMAAAMPFLAELEGRFARRMSAFLKDELGVKALLTDMSAGMEREEYRPVRAAVCDYVDEHWYWDHPSFPSNSWACPSVGHGQNPVRARGVNAMDRCSGVRLPDRPFTASEYCYAGPNIYRHMGGLVAGAQAAREDWAAIWRFDWAVNEPTLDRLDGTPAMWFELSGDALSMASDRAALFLFLRGDMGVGEDAAVASDRDAGTFTVNTPHTAGGFAEKGSLEAGPLRFKIIESQKSKVESPSEPNHSSLVTRHSSLGGGNSVAATVWASSLDGRPLVESRRILVSHLTDLCNEGQTFEDSTFRVLLKWGHLPHLVRAGRAEISLALGPADFTVYALDTAGRRVREVPHTRDLAIGRISFTADVAADPAAATFLYEITANATPSTAGEP